ncbi:hypothetical protein ACFE04_029139 [Oxalis oulophora]
MKKLTDPSTALLAACGGDTVKLFDVSVEPGDPCTLSYTPSPSHIVNSLKWNHTNLVVASAGEDKKISLWHKNGNTLGTIGTDSADNIEESIMAINFSNKGSRYICSGGSSQVVRIWDLQRKRCIKWLRGHTSTITGAMYNCKDEHLASISLNGDLMLHNLASGARAADLKDPNQQVLRVLDYSRISRHLLATAGDDGSVHLWDTTGHKPKISWLKQHSAPTAGISFSPANDKIIASVGLDKKLYTYDSGSRRHAFFISYEAPFSSLAFRDDGWVLAAGTSNGRVVFYDVRGKPQPFTVLRAYGTSEAVTSLCWQRSKPVIVNETTCSAETALLGNAVEDSILMPDPLPSMASSTLSMTSSSILSSVEETPQKNHLWPGGSLARLHAPRSSSSYNFKDDMEVFSPLVDVQPITPSLDKLWNNSNEGTKNDQLGIIDKKPSSILFPSSRRFPFTDDGANDHPIFDWKSSSASKQDDTRSSTPSFLGTTPSPSSKSEASSITPPEAWGETYNLISIFPQKLTIIMRNRYHPRHISTPSINPHEYNSSLGSNQWYHPSPNPCSLRHNIWYDPSLGYNQWYPSFSLGYNQWYDPSLGHNQWYHPTVESSQWYDPSLGHNEWYHPSVESSQYWYDPTLGCNQWYHPSVENNQWYDPIVESNKSNEWYDPSVESNEWYDPSVESNEWYDPSVRGWYHHSVDTEVESIEYTPSFNAEPQSHYISSVNGEAVSSVNPGEAVDRVRREATFNPGEAVDRVRREAAFNPGEAVDRVRREAAFNPGEVVDRVRREAAFLAGEEIKKVVSQTPIDQIPNLGDKLKPLYSLICENSANPLILKHEVEDLISHAEHYNYLLAKKSRNTEIAKRAVIDAISSRDEYIANLRTMLQTVQLEFNALSEKLEQSRWEMEVLKSLISKKEGELLDKHQGSGQESLTEKEEEEEGKMLEETYSQLLKISERIENLRWMN